MEKRFEEIQYLTINNDISLELAMLKSLEEFGELSKEVNRTLGIKRKENLSDLQIKKNILDELTDTIQNLFSVAVKCEITFDEIDKHMEIKNKKWKSIIEKELL
jgi:NTP pyrophosphatase (non-canonical NTP hydrolase)